MEGVTGDVVFGNAFPGFMRKSLVEPDNFVGAEFTVCHIQFRQGQCSETTENGTSHGEAAFSVVSVSSA